MKQNIKNCKCDCHNQELVARIEEHCVYCSIKQRAKRKADFISHVLSKSFGMPDEKRLIKEASKKFEDKNK